MTSSSSAVFSAAHLATPELLADPYPALAFLRETAPAFRIEHPFAGAMWLVTRYEEVTKVLRDPRFCVDPHTVGKEMPPRPRAIDLLLDGVLLQRDAPDHTRLRGLLSKVFTPRLVEGLRPRIQEICDSLIDAALARGEMEFISDFAFPLPIIVIGEMLGFPTSDRDRLRDWSAALFDTLGAKDDATMLAKAIEFRAYVEDLVAQKRRAPADDLITALVKAEDEGQKLSEAELLTTIATLIFAGHETTVNLLGNGLLALLTHPEELSRLRGDRSLIPSAVEELLRYVGPVNGPAPRFATEDIELCGVTIPRGDAVLVSLASAGRDGSHFTDADKLNVARSDNKHVAFGLGAHYCIGAPLARLEAQVAFDTLFRRLPDLRLAVAPHEITWRGHIMLRGLTALPVMF